MDRLKFIASKYKLYGLHIPSLGFIDLIDILICAFFIYKIIVWIRQTRAWTLFNGILVILIFSFLALVFKLNTILFILKKSIEVGTIAVIVVFQPELRKALEELGRGHFVYKFFMGGKKEKNLLTNENIEEIIMAVKRMQRNKIGALIVFEQKVPLGDHEKTGILIDSQISSQLLQNIFEPNTPLHDGAVIIKHNRISSASCFLPLSYDQNISQDLGTRHRAAVGVSEVSDAMVLVVSEETATISFVYKSQLTRDIKAEQLHQFLGTAKEQSSKKKGSE